MCGLKELEQSPGIVSEEPENRFIQLFTNKIKFASESINIVSEEPADRFVQHIAGSTFHKQDCQQICK